MPWKVRGGWIWIVLAASFLGGILVRRVSHTGSEYRDRNLADMRPTGGQGPLAVVDGKAVAPEEIEWEMSLLRISGGIGEQEVEGRLRPGSEGEQRLREEVAASLLERRILYSYVVGDKDFNSEDPARYVQCLEAWQAAMAQEEISVREVLERDGGQRLKAMLCEKSLVEQYVQELVYRNVSVSDPEIDQFYQQNAQSLERPERVIVRQIVLATESAAKDVEGRLNRENFAAMAREHSITPEGVEGGRIGPFARGEMPQVLDDAFKMRKGQISGIVKSTYGFHIMMLEDKIPGSKLTLDEAREEIRRRLEKQKREDAYSRWVEQVLGSVKVAGPGGGG